MGGEKQKSKVTQMNATGSPPHGRGKGYIGESKSNETWITPAWAGKSSVCSGFVLLLQDHPRMGGEKFGGLHMSVFSIGSPPHGRGKADVCSTLEIPPRITPAWAGKSTVLRFCLYFCEDHPRMGGEKLLFSTYKKAPRGSPPHGRGKAPSGSSSCRALGITPAWAGKRYFQKVLDICTQDHPRMGGEKYTWDILLITLWGSPPHGRGKVGWVVNISLPEGITPAWAGKSGR